MNEKELKKEIVEIFKKYKSVEDIGTRLIMLGFQKGKLEAIKDELNFLREIEKGKSCIDTKMFLKLRIEQLQKEIKVSGDSLTEFWDNPEDDRWDKEEEKQNE